jgi:nitrate reductase alpha subunit
VNLYNKFISLGKLDSIGMHGISWDISDLYHELFGIIPTEVWGGEKYPSVKDAVDAADVILHLAPETNGESAYRAWEAEEKKTGMPLKQIGEDTRAVRMRFKDIQAQPRRFLTTPCWTGDIRDGRTYSSYVTNVENKIPWRTLTGRQHFYLDHEGYIEWKENLPTYKAKPAPTFYGDIVKSKPEGNAILLNYLTPHCKWTIHSTYYDNLRMLTLSRGLMPFWIGDGDAEKIGIVDNDWVEIYNDHGVVVTRAVVSHRIPDGICMIYHAPERTISIPKSPLRGNKRGGAHNSLIRARLKPVLMMGGYGHFTYFFNYWGPTGVNRDTHVYVRKLEGEPKW